MLSEIGLKEPVQAEWILSGCESGEICLGKCLSSLVGGCGPKALEPRASAHFTRIFTAQTPQGIRPWEIQPWMDL